MSNSVRVAAAIIFLAIMAGWNFFAHKVADFGGVLAVLALIPIIFWLGIKLENRIRAVQERPAYTAYDFGQDVRSVLPNAVFWGLFVLAAFVLTRFI